MPCPCNAQLLIGASAYELVYVSVAEKRANRSPSYSTNRMDHDWGGKGWGGLGEAQSRKTINQTNTIPYFHV
jgi:hypothetical protein